MLPQIQAFVSKMTRSLSDEQRRILDAVIQGNNVFYTGNAGTGKTYLLQQIILKLRSKFNDEEVAVTASTGLAAINLGGSTIHSFAGIGLGKGTKQDIALSVRANSKARKRWSKCKVLIIDEISQLSAEVFQILDFVAKKIRPFHKTKSKLFFGGIQVIVTGDFGQLPPVGLGKHVHYCFDCELWMDMFHKNGNQNHFLLTNIFRQNEACFLSALNECRKAYPSDQAVEFFQSLDGSNQENSLPFDGVEIVTTNARADKINNKHLSRLINQGMENHTYEAVDEGVPAFVSVLAKEANILRKAQISLGSKVIVTKNVDGLANGQQGVVVDFQHGCDENEKETKTKYPVVEFRKNVKFAKPFRQLIQPAEWLFTLDGEVLASCVQVPLRLGWAITAHRSQGMEFSSVRVDLERIFEYGQAYVALSRCTNSKSLFVRSFTRGCIRTHPKVSKYLERLDITASANRINSDPLRDISACEVKQKQKPKKQNKREQQNENHNLENCPDTDKVEPPVSSKKPCLVPASPTRSERGSQSSQQRITRVPETPKRVVKVQDTP